MKDVVFPVTREGIADPRTVVNSVSTSVVITFS